MKRAWFLLISLFMAGASFTAYGQNRSIYFEGTALRGDHLDFFLEQFAMEARALELPVASQKNDAGYTFHFDVAANSIVYDDGTVEPPQPGESQFVVMISLLRNEDGEELVSFGFPFTDVDEMYEFNQYLVFKAAVYIPEGGDNDPGPAARRPAADRNTDGPENDPWQNQWLYIRLSFDLPVTFYKQQDEGAYNVDYIPGFTIGFEGQFLDFMSAELNFGINIENEGGNNRANAGAGLELKFPLRLKSGINFSPYLAAFVPVLSSGLFSFDTTIVADLNFYKSLSVGAGLQAGIKEPSGGFVFLDLSCMFAQGTSHELFPDWSIGLGIGYKFGFFDR